MALAAHYVGSTACVACHGKEAAEWRQSQHHDAMAEASDQSVRGNFNDAKFTYSGITSTFSKRDGKFLVNTDGRDGKLHDFEVKYTFGVYPLQQYLIEFPDGRLQALSIAWDARPKKEGGQRWFHLYPKERITYDDELHWTRPAQNWNFMCADCHSTDVRKNYDPVADRFQTRWAEISVGCEACHGPGSRHLEWAKSQIPGWSINATTGNASRSKPRATEREIEVCAQCHGRRSQIAEGYEAGKPFLDYYLWQRMPARCRSGVLLFRRHLHDGWLRRSGAGEAVAAARTDRGLDGRPHVRLVHGLLLRCGELPPSIAARESHRNFQHRKDRTMKTTRRQKLLAAALVGALTATTAPAQQVPISQTTAEVRGPSA